MENASKALLIAGSVLIVIVLIAFGMRIFNSTTGTTDSVEETMNATEVAMFNNKFTPYIGTNKTKAQVISLLNAAIVNNSTNTQKKVSINGTTITDALNAKINVLGSGPFDIEIYSYTKEGYISIIKVTYRTLTGEIKRNIRGIPYMENAVDALKIAAAILIFIIAIGTSFSLFGTAKETADSIITMRDKQAYLQAAELDNGILYTSSSAILGDTTGLTDEQIENLKKEASSIGGVTKNGDRIVNIDDIISTISRYNKEKYGVTVVESDGTVLVRFDSNTENIMSQYNNIESGLSDYEEKLEENTSTIYANPKFKNNLKTIYGIYKIEGLSFLGGGAPWYGNDSEIQKRITADLLGAAYNYYGQRYNGAGLLERLKDETIVEVTNEIDQSKYLSDTDEEGNPVKTDLLQQYKMPTIEIIYIILD